MSFTNVATIFSFSKFVRLELPLFNPSAQKQMENLEDWVLAIPSYRRSDKIARNTLAVLDHYDVEPERIFIFVGTEEEKAAYDQSLEGRGYHIVLGKLALNDKRNFILDYFPRGKHIVMMDDDIKALKQRTDDRKIEPLHSLKETITRGFQLAKEHGASLWGVYPCANGYFMTPNYSTDLKFVIGTFFGIINTTARGEGGICSSLCDKDDYERSILAWERDGVIVRLNDVSMQHTFYTGNGGLNEPGRIEKQEAAVQWLIDTWPQYVRRNTRRKSNYPEILLKRTKKRIDAKSTSSVTATSKNAVSKKNATMTKTTIHQFWHAKDSLEIPEFLRLSLWSFATFPQHRVILWSYQKLEEMPENVELRDASELVSRNRTMDWIDQGIVLEHVSDVIRLHALWRYGGWWVDCDTIALKPFSGYNKPYAFQTMPVRRTGSRKPSYFDFPTLTEQEGQEWDGKDRFNGGVMKAPAKSAFLKDFIEDAEANVHRMLEGLKKGKSFGRDSCEGRPLKDKNNWGMMSWAGKQVVKKHNLQPYVCPPKVFHPWRTEISQTMLRKRLSRPTGGPYPWYGSIEPDIATLMQEDSPAYCLCITGATKYTYESNTFNALKKMLFASSSRQT